MKPTMLASLALVVAGCSMLNRNGPDVTCADLAGGQKNACKDGIIASCPSGATVEYKVCEDKAACDASWQTTDEYRCAESDPPSIPGSGGAAGAAGSGGSAGYPGTGGTGVGGLDGGAGGSSGIGAGGVGGAGGSSGSGGTGASGSGGAAGSGTGGTQGCGPTDVCTVADSGGTYVDAIAVDGESVFFSNRATVWSVPREGGFPTALATDTESPSYGYMFADSTHVYLLRGEQKRIARVPKSGGAMEAAVACTGFPSQFVLGSERLFWVQGTALLSASKSDPASTVTVANDVLLDHLAYGGGYVYWIKNGTVSRVPETASGPTPPSAIDVSPQISQSGGYGGLTSIAADTSGFYVMIVAGGNSYAWSFAPNPMLLGQTGDSPVAPITVNTSAVYWIGAPNGNSEGKVLKVPKAGGAATKVASQGLPLGTIVADDSYVYWSRSSTIWRGPK